MARHDPPEPAQDGQWLAARAVAKPVVMAQAQRLFAGWQRSNDGALYARQFLERELKADPERTFTGEDYRYAASVVEGIGEQAHAEVLEAIAAADYEIREGRSSWEHRYDGRPLTAWERHAFLALSAGEVVPRRRSALGIDGALYAPASFMRDQRFAVVMTTSATTRFVVPFSNISQMLSWLTNRGPEAPGPLMAVTGPPGTRAGREEAVLAAALRSPQDAGRLLENTGPHTWTADLRAELAAALEWTTERGGIPDYAVIGWAFARRLLRAPGTAAGEIGWPGMTRAMTYLRRLAETPVTPNQAESAAGWLAAADAKARRNAHLPLSAAVPKPSPAPRSPAARAPQYSAPARTAAVPGALLPPPPGLPGQAGPVQQI